MRLLKTNLHRAGRKADWETIPKNKRNPWQRLAFSTKGVVTPANVTSVIGALLVLLGLYYIVAGDLWWGLVCVAIGRLADILDGAVAQATGTKSSVGEAVDVGLDKTIIVAAIVAFFITGVIPLWAVALIGARNVINAALGLLGKARKKELHPTRTGKLAAALEWVAILLFIVAAVFRTQQLAGGETAATVAAALTLVLAMLLGAAAIKDYSSRALNKTAKL
ncbi:MAG: CDP-alcohol phosphatidyltransferase family protein [Candidatus Saccharimonadales bacterium]